MNMKKIVASAAALSLTAAVAVGGTLAYLTQETNGVRNTFTYSSAEQDITLTLKEYKVKDDGLTLDKSQTVENNIGTPQDYTIVPGATAYKEPFLRLETENPSYVYVSVNVVNEDGIIDEVALENNIKAQGWLKLDGETMNGGQVYYKEAPQQGDGTQDITIFKEVKYNNIAVTDETDASIEVYGYAIAAQGMTGGATGAWNTAKDDFQA